MINILVIDDDDRLNKAVCAKLRMAGYNAHGFLKAMDAFDAMIDLKADLIISDIMMPEMDGYKFAKTLRDTNKVIPILFISALDSIDAKTKGFRAGIDDYMTKPVDLDELLLRITALLRRARIETEKKLTVGSGETALTLDADQYTASIGGNDIQLTVKEFNILYKLLSNPGRAYTRNQLMDDAWGAEVGTESRSVDVYVGKLRDKFSQCTAFEIATVHGLGYKAIIKDKSDAQ
jgi:DNA-binding response OmpR family regulator